MMSGRWFAGLLLLLTLAGQAAEPESPLLRVGVSEVPPFAIRDGEDWRGISVELWEQVAEQAGYRFEYHALSFEQLLPALERRELDLAIGALTMTAERERVLDFSHPFYRTGLAIAVARDASSLGALRSLLSWQFLSMVLALAALLLAVGAVFWLFERHHNRAQFGDTPAAGLGNGFWLAAVTMTTVGYGDKAPVTLGGRLVAIIWMFTALVMVSTFTAAITSILTVDSLRSGIRGADDLAGAVVATVADTASEEYLESRRINMRRYPDLLAAMQAVQLGQAEALVYDRPLLQYRNAELSEGGLHILPGTFDNQSYAFALVSGSPYREEVSRTVCGSPTAPTGSCCCGATWASPDGGAT